MSVTTWGCCCRFVSFLALLLGVPAALYFTDAGNTSPEVFPNDAVEKVLPLAPTTFPKALQGVIWMDQHGTYAHTDIGVGASDLALSFGDNEFSTWDPQMRTVAVDVAGPGWTWMNRWDGYLQWWLVRRLGFFYIFEVSPDEAVIQIYPCVDLGRLGRQYCLPKWFLSFTMEKVKPPPGTVCPPKTGSSKMDTAKCASWDRVSTGFFKRLLGDFAVLHYYAFQIVDGSGNRVQPYYDAYLQFAHNSCRSNASLAQAVGIDHSGGAPSCFVSFHGTRHYGATTASRRTEL